MANSTVKIWLSLRMQTNDGLGGVTIFIRRYAIFFSEAFYQMAGIHLQNLFLEKVWRMKPDAWLKNLAEVNSGKFSF